MMEDYEEDYFDEDDYEEQKEQEKADCYCGAYQFVNGRYIQVADCCC